MLKHQAVILTLGAVEHLEEKLLYQIHKVDRREKKFDKNIATQQTQVSLPRHLKESVLSSQL